MACFTAGSGGQEQNGEPWLKDLLSHGSPTLLFAPVTRIAPIHGGREGRQHLRVGLRLLRLASDQRQRQTEQGPAAIWAGSGLLWLGAGSGQHARVSRCSARARCRLPLEQERHQHSGSKKSYACNEKRPMQRVHERLVDRLVQRGRR